MIEINWTKLQEYIDNRYSKQKVLVNEPYNNGVITGMFYKHDTI